VKDAAVVRRCRLAGAGQAVDEVLTYRGLVSTTMDGDIEDGVRSAPGGWRINPRPEGLSLPVLVRYEDPAGIVFLQASSLVAVLGRSSAISALGGLKTWIRPQRRRTTPPPVAHALSLRREGWSSFEWPPSFNASDLVAAPPDLDEQREGGGE
jgi:hypothetical protein